MADLYTPAQFIREVIFGFETQAEMAKATNYTPVTISRFETGARRLSLEARERIFEAACARKLKFDRRWFDEVPSKYRGRKLAA